MDKNNFSKLPIMALDEIPDNNENAKTIVALKKEKGRVVGYKLSDGKIVSKEQGVSLAKQGEIKNIEIAKKYGKQYLKSIPDDKQSNNLGSLPSI